MTESLPPPKQLGHLVTQTRAEFREARRIIETDIRQAQHLKPVLSLKRRLPEPVRRAFSLWAKVWLYAACLLMILVGSWLAQGRTGVALILLGTNVCMSIPALLAWYLSKRGDYE